MEEVGPVTRKIRNPLNSVVSSLRASGIDASQPLLGIARFLPDSWPVQRNSVEVTYSATTKMSTNFLGMHYYFPAIRLVNFV